MGEQTQSDKDFLVTLADSCPPRALAFQFLPPVKTNEVPSVLLHIVSHSTLKWSLKSFSVKEVSLKALTWHTEINAFIQLNYKNGLSL